MLSATHPKEKGPCRASQPRLASPTRATCAIRLKGWCIAGSGLLIQASATERPIALPPVRQTGSASMATDKECMEYARECVRLAGLADDQQIRDQLLSMAHEWTGAAMHEDEPPRRVRRTA
jgi:hypothetical protein